MKVFKFGGASVKSAGAVRNVCDIIQREPEQLAVVISAMGNSTNLLETLVRAYYDQSDRKWEIAKQFKEYHMEVIEGLFGEKGMPQGVYELFNELEHKLKTRPAYDYNFEYDQIICYGELISTRIVSDYMNAAGQPNKWMDVRSSLKTNDTYRDAKVDWEWTDELVKEDFNFSDTQVYITQGFMASTSTNMTTTLGREGSDFTAAILGSVLEAESVSIWKDVPGIMSADPKKMKDSVFISELSYKEAVEMTHSGAKVIHPKTMQPLHNKGIPLLVRSFVSPDDPGTVIHKIDHRIELPPIFILKENQVLITLSAKDFSIISINDIDRVVNFLIGKLIKVTLMQQSAIDLNIVADATDEDLEEVFGELSEHYKIRYNTGLTLVTIRHYTEDVLDWMVKEKDIYLEQHSRLTARMLIKE
ncbi:aspartate kinase [Maribellus sp. CM-23]|uniref:aspartate kinase n=1 Tax=Maribellus sp. CM-23 TaxID=2781026 RepID=UPI001F487371|nr:aspartate kinase [Maribellus sp. CM-23]MCE4567092.1 aspartate kinase [Maribellus sp. CM-23]